MQVDIDILQDFLFERVRCHIERIVMQKSNTKASKKSFSDYPGLTCNLSNKHTHVFCFPFHLISLHSTYYPARSVSLNLSLHSAVHPSIHPSTYPPIHPSTHLCALLIVCLLCQDHKGIFVCFLFTVESRGHIKAPLTISPTQGQMQAGALGQASARTPLCHASSF